MAKSPLFAEESAGFAVERREPRDHPGLSANGKHFVARAGLPRSLRRTKDRDVDLALRRTETSGEMIDQKRHQSAPIDNLQTIR
ncbi:MAG: hypothetical protein ACJ8AH_16880 [Stellaceae bacterium]|jgi:hypothetical protein